MRIQRYFSTTRNYSTYNIYFALYIEINTRIDMVLSLCNNAGLIHERLAVRALSTVSDRAFLGLMHGFIAQVYIVRIIAGALQSNKD